MCGVVCVCVCVGVYMYTSTYINTRGVIVVVQHIPGQSGWVNYGVENREVHSGQVKILKSGL